MRIDFDDYTFLRITTGDIVAIVLAALFVVLLFVDHKIVTTIGG